MKALIAMSGGVDSSVAAKLTIEAGFECIGCTMELFDIGCGGGPRGETTSDEAQSADSDNVRDARSVAERLGMSFYAFDLKETFRCCVIDKFTDAYSHGVTPNPCVDCNKNLKFGALLQKAEELGCEYIVTGHYARIERDPHTGKYLLRKAVNDAKDQSYVLYNLTQEQLAHVLMPLGEYSKDQVRELAKENGFVNADRPESQDICFVPDGDYASVIKQYTNRTFPEGDYVDLDGNVIGTHRGIIHYTIGQHKHLGQAFGEKRYVCRIDADKNQVVPAAAFAYGISRESSGPPYARSMQMKTPVPKEPTLLKSFLTSRSAPSHRGSPPYCTTGILSWAAECSCYKATS